MTFDWRKEYERQHGKLPGPVTETIGDGDDVQAEEADAGAQETGDHAGQPPSRTEAPRVAAVGRARVAGRSAAAAERVEARKAEPGRPAAARRRAAGPSPDRVLDLLDGPSIAGLKAMAKEAGKSPVQLAADLLTDLLADDAAASEPEPAATDTPAPQANCTDCYDKPGIVIDAFMLRGLRIQKVKCPTCGKTRNRQTGSAE